MNKRIKTLVIGGVVLLVLIGALVALLLLGSSEQGEETAPPAASVMVLEKNITTIEKLTIKNKNDEIVMTQDEDGVFDVEVLKDLPTNEADVKNMFSAMAVIEAVKVVEEEPKDLSEYGFDDPEAVITAEQRDGSTYTLTVSMKSPLGDGYYAMLEGDPKVYLVRVNPYEKYVTVYGKDFLDLVFTSNAEGIDVEEFVDKITLFREDIGYDLVFENLKDDSEMHYAPMYSSGFVMTAPIRAYIESAYFADVADTASSFRATSVVELFPSEDKLAEYGLDDPTAVFSAVKNDGTTVTIKVGKGCYSDPTTDEEPGTEITGHYIQLEGRDAVYYVKYTQMWFMRTTVFEMLSQIPFAPNIIDVSTVEVEAEGKKYTIAVELDESGESVVGGTIDGTKLTRSNLTSFYIYAVSALANGLYLEQQTDAPLLTVTFNFSDASKSPLVATFHDIGDRKASITVNGETRFETRMAYVDNFFSNIIALSKDEAINMNY